MILEKLNAEERFRQAFERLKKGKPEVISLGASVSQNNVAREASCDPSALKKSRFPALVREIQAYLELQENVNRSAPAVARRRKKRSLEERSDDAIVQRDKVQSLLASANSRIVELTVEVGALKRQLEEFQPSPHLLGRR